MQPRDPVPAPLPDCQRLPLQGAVNFRDLGGYPTLDGRRLKRGRIFRSDHLSRLTPADLSLLTQMRFKLVCDFRTMREESSAPDLLPADGSIRRLHLPVEVAGFDPATALDRVRAGETHWLCMEFFVDLYQHYLDEFAPVWGEVLGLAADPAHHPLVFHCTGGKDRTGICAALILLFLGVSEEEVLRDHDLSNACNAPRLAPIYARFAALGVAAERVAPFLQAPAEPLTAMLRHLRQRYGSIEGYLLTKAGVQASTLNSLRTLLLA